MFLYTYICIIGSFAVCRASSKSVPVHIHVQTFSLPPYLTGWRHNLRNWSKSNTWLLFSAPFDLVHRPEYLCLVVALVKCWQAWFVECFHYIGCAFPPEGRGPDMHITLYSWVNFFSLQFESRLVWGITTGLGNGVWCTHVHSVVETRKWKAYFHTKKIHCLRWDLNPWPTAYRADALPTEAAQLGRPNL